METSNKAYIEIAVTPAADSCIRHYRVRYRRSDDTAYIYPDPVPAEGPIRIDHLEPDMPYEVRVAALCCNNAHSAEQVWVVRTSVAED